jgi:1-deoxy-D-xylulose-5-phosphate synthase
MVYNSLAAADLLAKEGILAEVVNMRFVKPIDRGILEHLLEKFDRIVTVEENTVHGGFGAAILETLATMNHRNVNVHVHGIPDSFIEHGTPNELYQIVKLDPRGIADVVKEFCEAHPSIHGAAERRAL